MGSEYAKHSQYKAGDDICCVTTMTALPVHIDKIHEIDYNLDEITVTGYGIIFIDSPLSRIPPGIPLKYAMVAFVQKRENDHQAQDQIRRHLKYPEMVHYRCLQNERQ
jgi:hypothetical protein